MLDNLILLGFLGSLSAGLMTTIGAIPVLFGKMPSERTRDTLLGFAAGVMLAASFFSLIVPSLDLSTERYGCLLYTSPSPRDLSTSRMPSSA